MLYPCVGDRSAILPPDTPINEDPLVAKSIPVSREIHQNPDVIHDED